MEQAPARPQITTLLSNELLARVEQLRINAGRRFTSRMRGEHLAGRSGSSIEFRDYRDYAVGDDMRFVDWNIFSRLRRPYIKLFHQEERMNIVLLIDASSSMMFEDKLQRAKELAAAFGVMGLMAAEPVSAHAFNQRRGRTTQFKRRSGRAAMRDLFAFIESIEGGGDGPVDQGIEAMLAEHRGRGVVIVLSDFLTPSDMRRSINLLFSAGLEMFGVQILGPTELDPQLTDDLRLVDSETQQTLDVTAAGDLIGLYHEYREKHARDIEQLCKHRSGRFMTISSTDPIDTILLDTMRRRGWVR